MDIVQEVFVNDYVKLSRQSMTNLADVTQGLNLLLGQKLSYDPSGLSRVW